MSYICELGTGRKLFLDNDNGQTTITISSTNAGQQQQASSSFHTGAWKTIPEVYLTPDGAMIKLSTTYGEHYIRVQGNNIGVSEALSLEHLHEMQIQQVSGQPGMGMAPMQPMQPMQPLKPMAAASAASAAQTESKSAASADPVADPNSPSPPSSDLSMTTNSMQMRMGNMEMKLGNLPPIGTMPVTRRFCSQCGAGVKPSDRFCSSCGHELGS
jgi:zinc-ribbon domain